jgi:serine/threonine protein kinase
MATFERPTHIGKYEILATLGRGGMGVVYKARDPHIDRIVAIKTILVGEEVSEDDSLADRLTMEARSAGRLHHPNIVTVFDFGTEGEMSYIVMEYVEGINLAKLIDERRPMPLDTKINLLIQIANGLAYAHERSVIHRDMKPSNICIASPGTAKILDFGLARFDNTRLTKTGYMAGTIAYMSPERLSGATGIKDDIFALGAIAYELLTYQRAFPGGTPPEVISKIIAPEPPRAPSTIADLPEALDPVVLKALAKKEEDRYASAAHFADALRRLATTDVIRTVPMDGATLEKPIGGFIDARPSASVYGVSSNKTAEQATAIVADVTTKGASTKPDLDLTETAAAPTTVVPEARRPNRWPLAAVAAVVIVTVTGLVLWQRPLPVVKQTPPVPVEGKPTSATAKVTATSRDPLAEQSEVQLVTAQRLSDQLEKRSLNARESIRFSKAKAQLTVAERKINDKDYKSGARLVADAIAGLQDVISTNDQRLHIPPTTTVAAQPKTTIPVPLPAPAPQPVRIAEPQPAPAPQPRAETTPAPAPVHESPEKEIANFMQDLAEAYQKRDVAFFRQHWAHFSDQLASAVQKSPSVRVELQIQRIDLRDAQHASVSVKRTDWFPDAAIPPATQELVYHLERGAGGWQVASVSR